eukprot:3308066-Rhodomonas_salina.1
MAASYVLPIRAPHKLSFFSMVLIAIVLLNLLAPVASSYVSPVINSTLAEFGIYNTNAIALAAFGISSAMADTYFIDSGCTSTICCNSCYMRNLQYINPVAVKGLTGYKLVQMLVIENALFDPSWDINLIASDDIKATDWNVNLSANLQHCRLYKYYAGERLPTAQVSIEKCCKLHTLQINSYAVPM